LALQMAVALLQRVDPNKATAKAGLEQRSDKCECAAFYFTLEASPAELKRQVLQFEWGQARFDGWAQHRPNPTRVSGTNEYWNGLYLISIPSPAESLNTVNLLVRQTIAEQLKFVNNLVAIVIDPMGAIDVGHDLRTDLVHLRDVAETHGTFLFLLTEKHAFDLHPVIEHYSQSIVHLEYDPNQRQHRRLYIQKARGQTFRSGYHHFELHSARKPDANIAPRIGSGLSKGVLVYPSIEAQSAYAHELLIERQEILDQSAGDPVSFFPDEERPDKHFLWNAQRNEIEKIPPGSAVFLMGPPGAFKEHMASLFARASADHELGATIYVSFKADYNSIKSHAANADKSLASSGYQHGQAVTPEWFDSFRDVPRTLQPATYFFDARNPLLTPEEILFTIRKAIVGATRLDSKKKVVFRRAVIWGLRRLYDFPNFRDRVVQFLEALVTLLRGHAITCLLVDWPDKQTASTVPIVDLCQYIFLTRVCQSKRSVKGTLAKQLDHFWGSDKQVVLVRAQRTRLGIRHDQGAVFRQTENLAITREAGSGSKGQRGMTNEFEYRWLHFGVPWEEDLSLKS
jgi:KaiC/GvpD/RAD55 family RecA-like ATPase